MTAQCGTTSPIPRPRTPTGVPTHKAFLFASWRPLTPLTVTRSCELAGDRWSDVNTSPAPVVPYVRTGQYTLLNLAVEYAVHRSVALTGGVKNLTDDDYQLAWGFLHRAGRST